MVDSSELQAEPSPITVRWHKTALVLIDMQRDFLEPNGFGESLGNDISQVRTSIQPCVELLQHWRQLELPVIHTREGHLPDLSDVPANKLALGNGLKIGDVGPMGRLLIRGELGHALIPELAPLAHEKIIDKPGKGAFYNTDLDDYLKTLAVDTLVIGGVTSEVCVQSTIREATDRGYRCIAVEDCCASYFPAMHQTSMRMITSQGGIFGWVTQSPVIHQALQQLV